MDKEKLHVHAGGASSSKCGGIQYIPLEALEALGRRFELGVATRPPGEAWNALSPTKDQQAADIGFVSERLGHCIIHCVNALAKINGVYSGNQPDDDDAGAILFAGALLSSHQKGKKKGLTTGGLGYIPSSFSLPQRVEEPITVAAPGIPPTQEPLPPLPVTPMLSCPIKGCETQRPTHRELDEHLVTRHGWTRQIRESDGQRVLVPSEPTVHKDGPDLSRIAGW